MDVFGASLWVLDGLKVADLSGACCRVHSGPSVPLTLEGVVDLGEGTQVRELSHSHTKVRSPP